MKEVIAMSLHDIVMFVHVMSAITAGSGTLMSLVGLWALRRTQRVEQVRSVLGSLSLATPIAGISMLILVLTGLYMTATAWSWQTPWIDVAIVSLVLLFVAGAVMG